MEPKRDRWGRYILPDPTTGEERSWVRATTVSGLLSDRFNLEKWAARMVALGMSQRDDLVALAKTATADDKRKLDNIVKDAKAAAGSETKANIGTAIHSATEAYDRGEEHQLGQPWAADVEAYGAKMKELGIEVVPGWIERIVVVPQLGEGVAGTLDRMVTVPGEDLPVIADIKTGQTVHFSHLDHAIQQAIYANATHYFDPEDGKLKPMPEVDKDHALIIHIPSGSAKCEVHSLDIRAGWEAAQVAAEVRKWRARKDLSVKLGEE